MANNNRIFYACQGVVIAPCFKPFTNTNRRLLHGVQSVGITTTFNLEQAFELGQIQIYENIEGLPDVEVTIERVLDGYPLAYHLSTPEATSANLVGRSKERCCVGLGIYDESKDAISGIAPVEVYMSGMYINNISYTLPTEGNATESVTLVGNHKIWNLSTNSILMTLQTATQIPKDAQGRGIDEPAALLGSGGIQRREDVKMESSILPVSIYGVLGQGVGNNWDAAKKTPRAHIQNCSISTDFGREDILELGRKAPYYRAPNFPIEVTCEFEVIAISGDFISAYEEGNPIFEDSGGQLYNEGRNIGNNTTEETIKMVLRDGTVFDLGSKNRLSSVTYGGGDAGGGNATITFSYSNFNDLAIGHNLDPAKPLITVGYPSTTTPATTTTTAP
jgi:hypothetical protein